MIRHIYKVSNFKYMRFLAICLLLWHDIWIFMYVVCGALICIVIFWLLTRECVIVEHPRPADLSQEASESSYEDIRVSRLFNEYPRISQELEIIVNNIIRDFILVWYKSISADPRFSKCVKNVLFDVIEKVQVRVTEVDFAELLVLKLLPLVTKHFSSFAHAYETASSDALLQIDREDSKNFDLAVVVEFSKNYKRHRALSGDFKNFAKDLQEYLSERTKSIIINVLNSDELSSPIVAILSREVVSNCILFPLIVTLTSSDFWNARLLTISKRVLKERTQVQELRRALSREIDVPHFSEHVLGATEDDSHVAMSLSAGASGQEFEYYLKYLNGLTSQQELSSEKFFILTNLLVLSKNACLSGKEQEFQKRLQLAFNLLESRLNYITGASNLIDEEILNSQLCEFEVFVKSIDLQTVLFDSAYTQFFHEFLLKFYAHHSILNFWSFVEGIKIPLEDPSNDDMAINISENDILDLQIAYKNFLQEEKVINSFSRDYINYIAYFLKSHNDVDRITRSKLYCRARKCLLLLQGEAYKRLHTIYFPKFKESSIFLKMIISSNQTRSSIYANYISNFAVSTLRKSVDAQLDTVGIMVIGNIDKALDDILNEEETLSPMKRGVLNKGSYSNLFGKDTKDGIFDDAIFLDDSVSHKYDSEEGDGSEESESSELGTSQDILRPDLIDGDIMDSRIEWKDVKQEIGNLIISIDKLQRQLELLKHLILKAELTNNQSQLKLLRKSERTLSRELEYKELLKQQYTVLENANSLFGKTKVLIKTYLSEISAEDGKEVTYYIVNVTHFNGNQVKSWETPRRYSEFYKLNVYLKKKYGDLVDHLQKNDVFPKKVKISLKYHVLKSLLYKERRYKLQNYLGALLLITEVCQDSKFRRFLTDVSNAFSAHDYDIEVKKSPLSDSSLSQLTESSAIFKRCSELDFQVSTLATDEFSKESSFYDDERNFYSGSVRKSRSFLKPICDLFITLFSLNRSNSGWLRGRAIIVVLQQLLGSTIEKYIKDVIGSLKCESNVYEVLVTIKNILWVENVFFKSSVMPTPSPRTESMISKSKREASIMLDRLMVETCGKVVGLRSAKYTSLMLHAMLQNEYLNASLILEILDVIIDELF